MLDAIIEKFMELKDAQYVNDKKYYNFYRANFNYIINNKDVWIELINKLLFIKIKNKCANNIVRRFNIWLHKFYNNDINAYSKIIINSNVYIKICRCKNNTVNLLIFNNIVHKLQIN